MIYHPTAELREYLGAEFKPELLTGDDALVVKEARGYKSAADFYRRNKAYLYHLTWTSMSDWKKPFYHFVRESAPPPRGVLDYGCGIGADGLRLYDEGYSPVAFADYQSQCIKFLHWRLKKRNLKADVYDIEKDEIPRYPLVVCFNVIEHIETDEQVAFIERLAQLGEMVTLDLTQTSSAYDELGIHHKMDVAGLLAWIKERHTLISHKIFNVYANLITFRSEEATNGSSRTQSHQKRSG